MKYQQRIDKVVEYIENHLDESITLLQLCDVANFSQFHFHRLFSALVGMPLNKYIQYLKLKRAAYQLIFQKQSKIINIAFEAGFDSHEVFSRAFKKACGLSPSEFRKNPQWSKWLLKPYTKMRTTDMNIEIKTLAPINTALVQHFGDYQKVSKTVEKLVDWCNENNLKMKPSECYGIVYNDPETTPKDDFRFDLCMKVASNTKISGGDIKQYIIPGGRYAVARHYGSHENIGETVRKLYGELLSNNNEEIRDIPIFFQYHNFVHEVAETALITDIYLPLK